MIEIIISENDDNDGRPLREGILNNTAPAVTICQNFLSLLPIFVMSGSGSCPSND